MRRPHCGASWRWLGGLARGLILAALAWPPAAGQEISIKLGTLAPEGSPWHDVLMEMRQEWLEISGGRIELKIYAGGVQGDEISMIRKMSFNRLQGVAVTGAGLAHLEPATSCLQIPLMFQSYEELDHVLAEMAPELERRVAERGYVLVNWGDAGWVHFFTKRPVATLDEIRKLKLMTSAGDPETEELYKDFGFHVVPLSYTDVLASLQTGLVDAVQGPALYAMIEQWFGLAGYMVDVRWAALVGATVLRKDTWEQIPADQRQQMLDGARRAGLDMRREIRRLGDDAVSEMVKRGLTVVPVEGEALTSWQAEARTAYPKLRGTYVASDLFDRVLSLRNEFRSSRGPAAPPASAGGADPEANGEAPDR